MFAVHWKVDFLYNFSPLPSEEPYVIFLPSLIFESISWLTSSVQRESCCSSKILFHLSEWTHMNFHLHYVFAALGLLDGFLQAKLLAINPLFILKRYIHVHTHIEHKVLSRASYLDFLHNYLAFCKFNM